MNLGTLGLLACPDCGGQLAVDSRAPGKGDIKQGELVCGVCGRRYEISDGISDLTYPAELAASDQEFRDKYDVGADRYDVGLDWLFTVFDEAVRREMVDLLELTEGARVLEIGAGTGEDSIHILEGIGPSGTLIATDISRSMLEVAREKLADSTGGLELHLCNASALPFRDNEFDAAFHFGGINEFGDVRGAVAEMDRVVRPGGKVVVGDESVAPWLRRKLFGRILIKANPLYKHRPPLEKLPPTAREVRLRWLLGNAFYVIDYRVSMEQPPLDLDLPIPGKGDSLRSRFYGDGGR
jgi:ubiquinone/menaquinone biosynthesis C-methylase UbiE